MPAVVDQLRAKSPDELRQELTGLRREHFNLRVQKAVQQLNKPSELRRVRREIARALTVLREKEMSEFAATGKALEFARVAAKTAPSDSAELRVSPEIAAAAAGGAAEVAAAASAEESKTKQADSGIAPEDPESESESGPEPENKTEQERAQ